MKCLSSDRANGPRRSAFTRVSIGLPYIDRNSSKAGLLFYIDGGHWVGRQWRLLLASIWRNVNGNPGEYTTTLSPPTCVSHRR